MNAYEPLMDEHRLIEHMVYLIDEEIKRIKEDNEINLAVIDLIIDFLRTYARDCHEMKEEQIFFKKLQGKNLPTDYEEIIKILIADHEFARKTIGRIIMERERYIQGEADALMEIINLLKALVELYPKHIKKEENEFYKQTTKHLSNDEQQEIIKKYKEHDQGLIHKKYEQLIERLENN